jgi:hypothetical protein
MSKTLKNSNWPDGCERFLIGRIAEAETETDEIDLGMHGH